MKILYVTDLHGSKWKYDRLFEVAQSYQAGMVINGGDTICIQPGQLNEFTYVTIDLSTMKFDRRNNRKEQT